MIDEWSETRSVEIWCSEFARKKVHNPNKWNIVSMVVKILEELSSEIDENVQIFINLCHVIKINFGIRKH